jgi:hypothetical protein
MISQLLSLMLFTGTPVSAAPVSDIDVDRDKDKVRVEVAPPAHVGNHYTNPYRVAPRGSIWFNVGHAQVTHEFNDEGERVPLGTIGLPSAVNDDLLDATMTTTVMNVGGKYIFTRIGDMEINGGLNFSMANITDRSEAIPAIGMGAAERSSGFAPQNLTVFGEIQREPYSMRVGYIADLGPSGSGADERPNTDRQNAFQFGIDGRTFTGPLRLYGGADYFLTLPRTNSAGVDVDLGDVAVLHGGAGYVFGPTEIGLTALYRLNREGSPEPTTPTRDLSSGYNFGLVPYVTYAPAHAPYQISVKGAVQREYHDYGFAVAGRNDIAPRLGVTAGLTYNF